LNVKIRSEAKVAIFHLYIWFIDWYALYTAYTAFGQPSQQLRDPFEEHGD